MDKKKKENDPLKFLFVKALRLKYIYIINVWRFMESFRKMEDELITQMLEGG